MLSCGLVYRPTEIQREIEAFTSSTRPIRVATDAGDGFIKSIGNPQGDSALVAELVAAELGTWFGLPIPPFAIVNNCTIDLRMAGSGVRMVPPLFISKAVDGEPDAGNVFLSKLRDKALVAKLVVFDTWVRNCDRGQQNRDNLLYVRLPGRQGRYQMAPIDHGNCFLVTEPDFPIAPWPAECVEDPAVYGRMPEFDEYLTGKTVADAVAKLAELPRNFVESVVNSVPTEWGLGPQAKTSLANLICDRAGYVVNSISPRLVDDPQIPGL